MAHTDILDGNNGRTMVMVVLRELANEGARRDEEFCNGNSRVPPESSAVPPNPRNHAPK
jgi:hypothetical protein